MSYQNPVVYISSLASPQDNIKEAVLELLRWGFLNIELGGGTRYYNGLEDDVLNLKKKYKLNFLIHNYFPPSPENFVMNIASKDASLRNDTFKVIENAIRLTKGLGIDLYTLHPGFNRSTLRERDRRFYKELDPKEGLGKQNTKEDFYEGVGLLLNYIKGKGLRIGVENFFPFGNNLASFLDTPEEILGFLDFYKAEPNIGLLLDLGHLNVAANRLGFDKSAALKKIFNAYPKKIFEIHISENDGNYDLHEVSQPDSWQIELVRQNKKFLDDIPIVFEWRRSLTLNEQIYKHFVSLERLLG